MHVKPNQQYPFTQEGSRFKHQKVNPRPQAITLSGKSISRIDFPGDRDRNSKARVINECIQLLIKPEIEIEIRAAVALLFQIGKCRPQSVRLNESVNKLIKSFNQSFFTARNIGNTCYGLRGLVDRDHSTQALVAAIVKKIESCSENLDAQAIGNACYGLQNLDGAHFSTQALAAALAKKIELSRETLSSQQIGNACYGLQSLDGAHLSTHALVAALAKKVELSRVNLDDQAIGNACYGLQNLDGAHLSTHALVAALAKKVELSRETLSAQAIGNACYGLQKLDGAQASTQALVAALAEKVELSSETLSSQQIGNACYGLQKLDGAQASTQALVAALVKKVELSNVELSDQEIGSACYGLQKLEGAQVSTQALVAALAKKVELSRVNLDAQAIGNACYGLQNLDGAHLSTQALVAALAKKIELSRETLSSQQIGNACYGLQNLDGTHLSTQALVAALAKKVESCSVNLDEQVIGQCLEGLCKLKESNFLIRLRHIIAQKIIQPGAYFEGCGNGVDDFNETCIQNMAQKIINKSKDSSSQNLDIKGSRSVLMCQLVQLGYYIVSPKFAEKILIQGLNNNVIYCKEGKGQDESEYKIDFHHHLPLTAQIMVDLFLTRRVNLFRETPEYQRLAIITGYGRHSKRNCSIVKNAVRSKLEEIVTRIEYKERYRYANHPTNPGILLLIKQQTNKK